jgi:hypothetical protein
MAVSVMAASAVRVLTSDVAGRPDVRRSLTTMTWAPHEVAAPAASRYPVGRSACGAEPTARAVLGRGRLVGSGTGATVPARFVRGQRGLTAADGPRYTILTGGWCTRLRFGLRSAASVLA